jgi:hypothetical protein
MNRKRSLVLVLLGAFASVAAIPSPGMRSVAVAAGQGDDLQAQGMTALKTFWNAIASGIPQAFEPVLAPEYQVQRSDGSGFDRKEFLNSNLPKLAAKPEFTDVKVTGTGDLLVVRYYVTVDATIGGKTVEKHAPRLTVFRKQGDNWLVVAHSNFATLSK